MKIVTVIGARPQFVKAAAVSREFLSEPSINEVIVHTGQHFDSNMSDIFFRELEIPAPQYHLNVNGGSHGAMTGKMLVQIEEVLLKEKPDFLMVYGDTNSTLAGALAAKKLHCKVVHIEAGLRSFNIAMPEEVNRILTDRISDLLFCPSDQAVKNLEQEGFSSFPAQVVVCGDVMFDAALFYASKSEEQSRIVQQLDLNSFVLCTIHRAENTDSPDRLKAIISALNVIHEKVEVVVPLHPRTRKVIANLGLEVRFKIVEPVGYLDMIQLIQSSKLVLTDSGGLQKEAFFFGKHCVTLREETEWVELVENGFNLLAGANAENIVRSVDLMLQKESDFQKNLYGSGRASEIIKTSLVEYFNTNNACG